MAPDPSADPISDDAKIPGAARLPPGLYITATPIGNRGDITRRALDVLAACDRILCEDTRVTRKLLTMYGLSRPLIAYHDHNALSIRPKALAWIAAGEAVALVSDAGTPLVSDPGCKLAAEARERGLFVTALPGASAALTALMVAGLPTDRFLFLGFLPPRSKARREELAPFSDLRATLVVYESPRRLPALLADAAAVLPGRRACVCRELTKRFEETRTGTLAELAARYETEGPPKGEVVVVIGPPEAPPAPPTDAEIDAALALALKGRSVKDAVVLVQQATGLPRRRVYARALALSRTGEP